MAEAFALRRRRKELFAGELVLRSRRRRPPHRSVDARGERPPQLVVRGRPLDGAPPPSSTAAGAAAPKPAVRRVGPQHLRRRGRAHRLSRLVEGRVLEVRVGLWWPAVSLQRVPALAAAVQSGVRVHALVRHRLGSHPRLPQGLEVRPDPRALGHRAVAVDRALQVPLVECGDLDRAVTAVAAVLPRPGAAARLAPASLPVRAPRRRPRRSVFGRRLRL